MKSVLGLGGIKFWGRDRTDPLLEQTLSYVQGIAAFKPSEPPQTIESNAPKRPVRLDTDFMVAERADFEQRVGEFRARQAKIRQGREQYCNSMLQKTRATLGNAIEGAAL